MIPKIIHYCWFGGNPLPELAEKCIESWKKFCPDYEIIRWDETNFDINYCDYVREAYEAKKWAFVSDYARFKIIYDYGGVYFDTDVELLKPIDDLIKQGPFMGLESGKSSMIAPGLGLAANPGLGLAKEVLDDYENSHFIADERGKYEIVVERVTNILLRHGEIYPDEINYVAGVFIYPTEYLCPMNYVTGELSITDKTYAIHHFSASWLPEAERKTKEYIYNYKGVLPINIVKFFCMTRYGGIEAALKKTWSVLRRKQRGDNP